ncbi:restriction endonuclease [Cytobacillus firmus]|uniref:restriction endonuclease n=1 Tax=Cytobacillus firmus TaxID=1399 RepID=UPI00203C4F59|nr:restriction endonuclease [Cytobacillus firmus]MCM3704801.1 restriction endonuclease [Cytobacillus firmus]
MKNTVGFNKFINLAPDHEIWTPIPLEEKEHFLSLVEQVRVTLENGTKKEKGDALEELMTYVYSRFEIAYVHPDVHHGDNQIDHIVEFIDGMSTPFLIEHVGMRFVGESKNHKESIGVREVTDLVELVRSKRAKLGVFSSSKTFSRGLNKSPWINAEGKRRKLALAYNNEKIILGFTINEIETLVENNFYTLLKQKYFSLIDEIEDDTTDYQTSDLTRPYHLRLYDSLVQLKENEIINEESFDLGAKKITDRYGPIDI